MFYRFISVLIALFLLGVQFNGPSFGESPACAKIGFSQRPNSRYQESPTVSTPAETNPGVTTSEYGKTQDGHAVKCFTLRNSRGTTVQLLDYGATLHAVEFADRDGQIDNVVLNAPNINERELWAGYFGSTVGRFCNRIADGQFTLDSVEYNLAKNNGHNHLHGGDLAYDKMIWASKVIEEDGRYGVEFHLHSPDGDEGYPGNLDVYATYTLNDDNELLMDFKGESDKATPINITNHAFWNLAGHKSGTILEQELELRCSQYLEVDEGLIPTGQTPKVAGTALDFTNAKAIGERIAEVNQTPANGYDHCFVVDGEPGQMRLAAVAVDPESGRKLEVLTTQPGIQLYTANHLNGTGGYVQNSAFCLETQNYPDAPNQPHFPSSILRPGDTYHHQTIHRFGIVD